MTVSIPGALFANSLGTRRTHPLLQLVLNGELDSAPNPLPHQLFQRTFPLPSAPAIPLHRVILRHPPPSGRELWLNSPDRDAFSLFHQLPDTAIPDTQLFEDVEVNLNRPLSCVKLPLSRAVSLLPPRL